MQRQLTFLIGVLLLSSTQAKDLSEKVHQQLGTEGYFFGPTSPEVVLPVDRNRQGRYLICLSDDQTEFFIYELTEKLFPDGVHRVLVRCQRGILVVSKS